MFYLLIIKGFKPVITIQTLLRPDPDLAYLTGLQTWLKLIKSV